MGDNTEVEDGEQFAGEINALCTEAKAANVEAVSTEDDDETGAFLVKPQTLRKEDKEISTQNLIGVWVAILSVVIDVLYLFFFFFIKIHLTSQ